MDRSTSSTHQEDTLSVVDHRGVKHHLFRTRAEEDAAVARSPLKVAADLIALADKVSALVFRAAQQEGVI